jgi:hypothetical protein
MEFVNLELSSCIATSSFVRGLCNYFVINCECYLAYETTLLSRTATENDDEGIRSGLYGGVMAVFSCKS